jgi:hypothetical protein
VRKTGLQESMIKQVQLFLSLEDEATLSQALLAARPRVAFVDGARWSTFVPPLAPSISECKSMRVALWDRDVVQTLPYFARKDGQFEGPMTAVVLELARSILQEELILSGRLSASTGGSDIQLTAAMDKFASDAWKIMKSITQSVVAIDPGSAAVVREKVTEYRAGHHAAAWALKAQQHYFRDRSVQVFFKPKKTEQAG